MRSHGHIGLAVSIHTHPVPARKLCKTRQIQPFSQESRTATVPKVFQISLCGVVEADLELFCTSWRSGFLGERLYTQREGCRQNASHSLFEGRQHHLQGLGQR